MACSTCKKKNTGNLESVSGKVSNINKGVIVFVLIWSALGVYGLITLISKI